jgi:hypothetical protein
MRKTRVVHVRCEISRSAFSGERTFRVSRAGGDEYIGAAPVHYFYSSDDSQLDEYGAPQGDDSVEGSVEALLIENGGDDATVVFPGDEMVTVNTNLVRRDLPETVPNVFVR